MNQPFLKFENRFYRGTDHGQPIFLCLIEKYENPKGFIPELYKLKKIYLSSVKIKFT